MSEEPTTTLDDDVEAHMKTREPVADVDAHMKTRRNDGDAAVEGDDVELAPSEDDDVEGHFKSR